VLDIKLIRRKDMKKLFITTLLLGCFSVIAFAGTPNCVRCKINTVKLEVIEKYALNLLDTTECAPGINELEMLKADEVYISISLPEEINKAFTATKIIVTKDLEGKYQLTYDFVPLLTDEEKAAKAFEGLILAEFPQITKFGDLTPEMIDQYVVDHPLDKNMLGKIIKAGLFYIRSGGGLK